MILNAGAALYVAGVSESLEQGVYAARDAIDDGRATATLDAAGRVHLRPGRCADMSGYLARIGGDVRRDAPEPTRGFAEAIAAGAAVAVIAEVKRSSPSQGPIAPDADVAGTAVRYESGGAACLSVLCAERDFGGSLDHLRKARSAVSIPAIAKDFTVFPEQVAAQRLAGADAILVILAMVTDHEARRLIETAALLGMDALVETHDARRDRAGGRPRGTPGRGQRPRPGDARDRPRPPARAAGGAAGRRSCGWPSPGSPRGPMSRPPATPAPTPCWWAPR